MGKFKKGDEVWVGVWPAKTPLCECCKNKLHFFSGVEAVRVIQVRDNYGPIYDIEPRLHYIRGIREALVWRAEAEASKACKLVKEPPKLCDNCSSYQGKKLAQYKNALELACGDLDGLMLLATKEDLIEYFLQQAKEQS